MVHFLPTITLILSTLTLLISASPLPLSISPPDTPIDNLPGHPINTILTSPQGPSPFSDNNGKNGKKTTTELTPRKDCVPLISGFACLFAKKQCDCA
ncbi:hypothetical protein Slin15195_G083880 [Septoria linicola]|uniref:Uncharacterized protein n=1 Tax=Septoria linicola TaxID=215465 RepID=A0A9Q9ATD4_9PEZI|nr:hypothetical protein Slin14017_G086400 [Septoria linicola]USW55069.1 hypothetical protein Slin15195_G083880 [Septoria linicola]